MHVIDGIEFPDNHLRITPCTAAEIYSASPQEVARMIWRLRYNYDEGLFRQIDKKSFRDDIKKIDTIDWHEELCFVPDGLLYRWRVLLKKLLLWRENYLDVIRNETSVTIQDALAAKKLRREVLIAMGIGYNEEGEMISIEKK